MRSFLLHHLLSATKTRHANETVSISSCQLPKRRHSFFFNVLGVGKEDRNKIYGRGRKMLSVNRFFRGDHSSARERELPEDRA
jgi:hypothetical protein